MFIVQSCLANTYRALGRDEEAIQLKRDVYSGRLKLDGEEHKDTLIAAHNYANSLCDLKRFKEARSLLRKTIPVARRVLRDNDRLTLVMRVVYAAAIYDDPGATLHDLREAVTTLEDAEWIARRVLGGAHPHTEGFGRNLLEARARLRARETPSAS